MNPFFVSVICLGDSSSSAKILISKPLGKDKWFNYPLLIQAKLNGYVPPKEREKLSDEKWQGNVIIAYRDKKHKMSFRTVKGERLINDAFLIRV